MQRPMFALGRSQTNLGMVFAVVLVLAAMVTGISASSAAAITLPSGYSERKVADVPLPTGLAFLPDGRMLVAGKDGRVWLIDRGKRRREAVMSLRARSCEERERGLSGIAVDPNFERNRFVYVYWTRRRGPTCPVEYTRGGLRPDHPVNRLSRYRLTRELGVDSGSEKVLLDGIPQLFGTHNAGDLHFARDGYLYVSVGDGGCDYAGGGCAGKNDASRDPHVLLGKILRIRRDGSAPDANGGGDRCALRGMTRSGRRCRETFASGLRNPFRLAFDPNARGVRFFINDVGQSTWEEINQGKLGADYGWNLREGPCPIGVAENCSAKPRRLTDPIFSYRQGRCQAITGGAFLPRGAWSPAFAGSYLYADYVCGRIWRLQRRDGRWERRAFALNMGRDSAVHLAFGPGNGRSRSLFYTTFANGGDVRRVDYEPGNRAPLARARANPSAGKLPLEVTFDARRSVDPDGDRQLRYRWNFGDGSAPVISAQPVVRHRYTTEGSFRARLTVIDGLGRASDPIAFRIDAGNEPPRPTILTPPEGMRYEFGQTLALQGSAVDPEDGRLASERLSWNVVLHHETHTHPFLGPLVGDALALTAPYPEDRAAAPVSHLELRLTATDSRGLRVTTTRHLFPRLTIGLGGLRSRPDRFSDDASLPRLRLPTEPGDGFDFRLSAPARLALSTERATRREGCTGTPEQCLKWVAEPGQATLRAPAGASTIAFRGRVSVDSRPRAGLHRLRVIASDRWGRTSPVRTARYELLRP